MKKRPRGPGAPAPGRGSGTASPRSTDPVRPHSSEDFRCRPACERSERTRGARAERGPEKQSGHGLELCPDKILLLVASGYSSAASSSKATLFLSALDTGQPSLAFSAAALNPA